MITNSLDLNIMFKLASRQRPEKFIETVNNIVEHCSLSNYFILVSADIDDASMYNDTIHHFCRDRGILLVYGTSTGKVHAINRDVDTFSQPRWDILVNMSDDMRFPYKGFDVDIRRQFEGIKDLFVHFPDNNRKDICTISIMDRAYYDRFKYIYNPEYVTVCCDDEATEVAKILGRYKYVDTVLVKHLHPGYDTRYWDPLYVRNEAEHLYSADRETLKLRRYNHFNLKK